MPFVVRLRRVGCVSVRSRCVGAVAASLCDAPWGGVDRRQARGVVPRMRGVADTATVWAATPRSGPGPTVPATAAGTNGRMRGRDQRSRLQPLSRLQRRGAKFTRRRRESFSLCLRFLRLFAAALFVNHFITAFGINASPAGGGFRAKAARFAKGSGLEFLQIALPRIHDLRALCGFE